LRNAKNMLGISSDASVPALAHGRGAEQQQGGAMARDAGRGAHESYERDEAPSERGFGLVCAGFFAVLAALGRLPMGPAMRLLGKDPLRLRRDPAAHSYSIARTPLARHPTPSPHNSEM
jgi:hypothetical protein